MWFMLILLVLSRVFCMAVRFLCVLVSSLSRHRTCAMRVLQVRFRLTLTRGRVVFNTKIDEWNPTIQTDFCPFFQYSLLCRICKEHKTKNKFNVHFVWTTTYRLCSLVMWQVFFKYHDDSILNHLHGEYVISRTEITLARDDVGWRGRGVQHCNGKYLCVCVPSCAHYRIVVSCRLVVGIDYFLT